MSDKSYRIKTTVGSEDKVVSVNLKQGVKTLNILSLEINPEDAYDVQTSDYGVIVGRVLANKAFGIPNVKVSVFIPIEEEDERDYIISNEYPYKTPQSKDINGVKYNLIHQKEGGPGTFPSKNMLLDNNGTIEVYDKYWKYTTVTNESGDYMIFGVPTGSTQVHYDCDLSDIGILSQHPYDFISKGYSPNLFKSRNEFTDTDLESAVYIKSQDMTVFVYPFWGDKKNDNKIGITRNDIDIDYEFTPSCVFMGSSITDPVGSYIGIDGKPSGNNGKFDALSTSVGDIEIIRYTQDGRIEEVKDNVVGIIDGNGVWCYQIPMNLDRIGTDEYGNIIAISDPNRGIPTRARVRFRISLTDAKDVNASVYTAKFLVPCNPPLTYSGTTYNDPVVNTISGDAMISNTDWKNFYEFGENTPDCCFRDLFWGKVYSVKQYYPRFHFEYKPRDLMYHDEIWGEYTARPKKDGNVDGVIEIDKDGKDLYDFTGFPTRFAFDSSCISSIDIVNGLNTFPYTTLYAGAEEHLDYRSSWWFYYHISDFSTDYNLTSRGLHFCFENDWINGCLYFPRVIIQRNSVDNYDYFGRITDEGGLTNLHYSGIYLSGRHHWYYKGGEFTTKNSTAPFVWKDGEDLNKTACMQDQVSIFSRVNLFHGILTKRKTMLGESVFYYTCGSVEPITNNLFNNIRYKRLYSTDIILLGNLEDIYDSLPKLYNNLPATSAIFPPVSTPKKLTESGMSKNCYGEQIQDAVGKDTELIDIFGNNTGTIIKESDAIPDDYTESGNSLYAYALYSNTKPYSVNGMELMVRLLRRSSLFFGLKIKDVADFLEYDVPSFINTSRICELDVHNDAACLIPGTENEVIPINGMIDCFDISTNENRSAFATMNYDIENYIINPRTGYRQYVTTPLYMSGFEGRLDKYIENSGFKYEKDSMDESYTKFRFGRDEDPWRGPYTQTCTNFSSYNEGIYNYCNGNLVLPKDSFYFYFGLRTGFSAIDMLRDKFIGQKKETPTEILGIRCYVDPTKYVCEGGIETATVDVAFVNMSPPITYELYYKNVSFKNDISNSTQTSIDGLTPGVYKMVASDTFNRTSTSHFSVLGSSVSLNVSTYKDDYTHKGYLVFESDDESEIKSVVSGDSRTVSASTSTNTYEVTFSKNFEQVPESGVTVVFASGIGSVNLSIRKMGDNCAESSMICVFIDNSDPDIVLNNVPTKYLSGWKSFGTRDSYDNGEPDSIFSGTSYYVWDGINTAHPTVSNRNYKFPSAGVNYNEKLGYISSMCSTVFGNNTMALRNNSTNTNYVPLALSPDYDYGIYLWPYENWGKEVITDGIMRTSNNGVAQNQRNVPHIVGSNYPVAYDKRTFLKESLYFHDNIKKYINNETLRKSRYGVGIYGIYGINLFGVKHKQYSQLDLPGQLRIYPDIPITGNTKDDYYIGVGDAKNFFGIRTVDKRFDYQFELKTPLLLPSGYSLFNNLSNKPFINGKISFDLYGGFRLDYDQQSKQLTSYGNNSGDITGGPTSAATLYSTSIYQDDNIPTTLDEYNHSVWYSGENKDIDHVRLSGSTEHINGINNIELSFTDCSTDFSNGYVLPGDTETVRVSYLSPIKIIRGEEEDYDFLYYIQPLEKPYDYSFHEYYGSYSGSTLSFVISGDTEWDVDGETFTQMDTIEKDNGDKKFPAWSRDYEGDKPYSTRQQELAVYRCDPSSDGDFNVTSAYTVNFMSIRGDLPQAPQFSGSTYISPFYVEEDVVHTLTDLSSSPYVWFEINKDDNSKMEEQFGSDSFIIIPTRRVYTKEQYGTSLKQGVVYNMGYAYYAGSIFVSVDKLAKSAIIRLNTPLRDNDGYIDYNTNSLKQDNRWHTIGNVVNYYYHCDTTSDATLSYDDSKYEFIYETIGTATYVDIYFEIENGLRYKVKIEFE